jgi:hypothetical protein
VFRPEWRGMTQHLRRNILEVAGAIKVSNEREGVFQRISKSARLHDFLAYICPGAGVADKQSVFPERAGRGLGKEE